VLYWYKRTNADAAHAVIFVISSGSDPTGSLIKFAEEMHFLSRYSI
jgi:hypothetical protein